MSQEFDDFSQFSMLDLFRMEAQGQTQVLTDGLLLLERGNGNAATLDAIMRAAHSIKGAAAIVGLDAIVQLSHAMEDAFVAAQQGKLHLTPARIDVLLGGVDFIIQLSQLTEHQVDGWLRQNGGRIADTLGMLAHIGEISAVETPPAASEPAGTDAMVNATVPVLDDLQPRAGPKLMGQTYDRLLALASETRINAHQLAPMRQSIQRFKRNQAGLFKAIDDLHALLATSGSAALIEQSALVLQRVGAAREFAHAHLGELENYEQRALLTSTRLVDEVIDLRMRPFRDGVQHFPRMVRDLARSLGKDVQLTIEGESTLVDRDILAHIDAPLNHILRNAVDHGMETAPQRIEAGKPPVGSIRMVAHHRAGMLSIDISDDGRGVDLERIRQRVIERQMAPRDMAQAMSQAELLEFLFLPAFTLKDQPSAISGRGVGLDVVQQTIREENGSVSVESRAGLGFTTRITLPLTQSVKRVLVADIGGEVYAVPIARIERVLRVDGAQVHTLEGKQFIVNGGEHLGLVSAAQVLGLGANSPGGATLHVIVIGGAAPGTQRYALVVDAIRAEQSVTVHSLETTFGKLRDISAAALLDDGSPVLILDVPDLLLSIEKLLGEGGLRQMGGGAGVEADRVRRILVVDDSLTVREMERKLLTARGYQVDVAIDGMDGWNAVRGSAYDLVITDVDMPRMDGIELVGMIKKDLRLHALPVMIVSYKDRPEDRARGMTAGADYYLTKGSFHDETLLDAVVDLIGEARR